MKILYIHPSSLQQRDSQVVLPIGMIALGNLAIENGNEFKVINIPYQLKKDKNFKVEDVVKQYNPDVVMIDLHWAIYSYESVELAKKIKLINENIKIITGGITASIYYEEILKEFNCFDFIIRGDAEIPFVKLLKYLKHEDVELGDIPNLSYVKDGEIFNNNLTHVQTDLSQLNYFNYDFIEDYDGFFEAQASYLDFKNHTKFAWIPIARGCSYNCSYCGGNCKMFKKYFCYNKMNFNTPQSICNIMQKLYDKYNISAFGVTHDFGVFSKEYANQLLEEMSKLTFKPTIINYLFQLPSLDFFKKYKEVVNLDDSILGLSMVSGDESARRLNGKFYTNQQIFDTIELFKDTPVKIDLYMNDNNIGGVEKFDNTLKFINEIYSRFGNSKLNFNMAYALEILQPESDLYRGANGQTPTLNTFLDYYNRYSPKFLEELPIKKNLADVAGLAPYNSDCIKRCKQANELISSLKNKYKRS